LEQFDSFWSHDLWIVLFAPKKIYGIDIGLTNTIGFGFSPNIGKLLDNLVFLTLRRKTKRFITSPLAARV
jgi:predicted AAA+ superfamily ATPase